MTLEEFQVLKRASKRKRARKATPMGNALNLPTIPSPAPALTGGDTIPLVAKALASPSGDVSPPKEVIMEMVDVTTPLKETSLMEVVAPLEGAHQSRTQ